MSPCQQLAVFPMSMRRSVPLQQKLATRVFSLSRTHIFHPFFCAQAEVPKSDTIAIIAITNSFLIFLKYLLRCKNTPNPRNLCFTNFGDFFKF